jgi:hypothetical protein
MTRLITKDVTRPKLRQYPKYTSSDWRMSRKISGYPVSGLKFETRTSRIQSKRVSHSTATHGPSVSIIDYLYMPDRKKQFHLSHNVWVILATGNNAPPTQDRNKTKCPYVSKSPYQLIQQEETLKCTSICSNQLHSIGSSFKSWQLSASQNMRRLIRKMAVFLVVALCSLVEVYRRFRRGCCLRGTTTQKAATFKLAA